MSDLDGKVKRWEHAIFPFIVALWWVLLLPAAKGILGVGTIIYYGADTVERSTGLSSTDLHEYGLNVLFEVVMLIVLRVWWIQRIKKEIRERRAPDGRA